MRNEHKPKGGYIDDRVVADMPDTVEQRKVADESDTV